MIGINMSHVVSRPFLAARKGWAIGLVAAVIGLSLAGSPALAQTTAAGTDATTAAPAAAPANGASPSAPAVTPASPSATPDAAAAPAAADAPADAAPDTRGLDQEVQTLKKGTWWISTAICSSSRKNCCSLPIPQVAVFLSMDVGDFFALDSVQLKIDQKEVINYLYTPREVEALLRGGVHRLYLGNLKVGKHELVAFFSGKGPNDRDYKRGANLSFDKGNRCQVPGAQDQRPAAQAAARIRDQGTGNKLERSRSKRFAGVRRGGRRRGRRARGRATPRSGEAAGDADSRSSLWRCALLFLPGRRLRGDHPPHGVPALELHSAS